MRNTLYNYSPIAGRPMIRWPGGKRLAFYVGLNVEYYCMDRPSVSIFSGTASLVPDPLNQGWRDYGPRVGFWRTLEVLDELGMPASVLVNSDVVHKYPQIIAAGVERDWAWVAHGKENSTLQTAMDPDSERGYLSEVIAEIQSATGQRPRGWLGPALTETFSTTQLLADLGLDYTLDWTCDDQPFQMNVERDRPFLSVPYSIELNDITLFLGKALSGPDFVRMVTDQFDQLYRDSVATGRVMALCLHPFIIGQPFRHKYLIEALKYIADHRDAIWITTSDEIASFYLDNYTA